MRKSFGPDSVHRLHSLDLIKMRRRRMQEKRWKIREVDKIRANGQQPKWELGKIDKFEQAK